MNILTVIKNLTEDYKKKKCKCVIKGGNEPKLIIRENSIPHFRSNRNPLMDLLAQNLCNNKEFANYIYQIFILVKLMKGEINWFQAYLFLNKL